MFKKIVLFSLYTIAGINLGAASALFPIFVALLFAIGGNLYVAMGVSAALCAIIASVMYLLHFLRRRKEHDSADYRASGALLGYILGAVAIIVFLVTQGTKGDEGPITGY